jgi:hypothetical protein
MKKLLLLFISVAVAFSAMAQKTKKSKKEERRQRINAMVKQEEEGVVVYKKHSIFGLKLTNDGYGGFFEIGKSKTVKKATLFQLEIAERKHPKEEKQTNPFAPTAPVIYGKINFFYPVKLGVQQEFLLGNKSNKNGVSVTANGGGGLIIGLLRPYKLEVQDSTGKSKFIAYDDNNTLFLNGPVIGGPAFGTGWNSLKITPGAYAKASLRFDYGRYNEMVSAIETGIGIEFYSKKIPQMVNNKQRNLFLNAYVAILFGRRK